jgi:hypothetical protein
VSPGVAWSRWIGEGGENVKGSGFWWEVISENNPQAASILRS